MQVRISAGLGGRLGVSQEAQQDIGTLIYQLYKMQQPNSYPPKGCTCHTPYFRYTYIKSLKHNLMWDFSTT